MPAAPPSSPAPPRRTPAPPPRRHTSRAPLWRALTSVLVVGLALWAAVSLSPRLGLDLGAAPRSSWRPRTPSA